MEKDREEFERRAKDDGLDVSKLDGINYYSSHTSVAKRAWQARQPEIDALKAEVEQLRKDAEKFAAIHKTVCELMHDNITAMQAAVIEWIHGRGPDAALAWIVNTLSGPGLLPDENSPYGKEAQAWFDANKSRPFPKCFCGRPSHILWMGQGFCSEEHYEQREEHTGDAAMKSWRI